jgi:bifunctional non-homologous end joining protein LigD
VSADAVRVAGVTISNPDKVWWPDDGITKADVARFYDGIWTRVAPWLRDRPLTAERCPDGMRGGCFYQKDFPEKVQPTGAPRLVLRAASTRKDVHYLVGGSRSTLAAMVNLGCIAVHVMSTRAAAMNDCDWLAFDMDPESGEFADAARAGLALRRLLDEAKLASYPKTSGSRGLHVFVPLRAGVTPGTAVAFASTLGQELARREPKLVTIEHAKAKRGGRVFADSFRNGYTQTIVAPYSVRRRPGATVSTPLSWDEVTARLDPARFTMRSSDRRLAGPDPWADFWCRRRKLPAR